MSCSGDNHTSGLGSLTRHWRHYLVVACLHPQPAYPWQPGAMCTVCPPEWVEGILFQSSVSLTCVDNSSVFRPIHCCTQYSSGLELSISKLRYPLKSTLRFLKLVPNLKEKIQISTRRPHKSFINLDTGVRGRVTPRGLEIQPRDEECPALCIL